MQTSHLLVLAVDMPFVTREQLRLLCGLVTEGSGVVPMIGERMEPLAAIYPREAAPDFLAALAGTDFSLQRLISKLVAAGKMRTFLVPEQDQRLYLSLNEPNDLNEGRFPNRPPEDFGGLETAAP
jgi:molybdopterin-guanine dinucleotide biosynthesis protein A